MIDTIKNIFDNNIKLSKKLDNYIEIINYLNKNSPDYLISMSNKIYFVLNKTAICFMCKKHFVNYHSKNSPYACCSSKCRNDKVIFEKENGGRKYIIPESIIKEYNPNIINIQTEDFAYCPFCDHKKTNIGEHLKFAHGITREIRQKFLPNLSATNLKVKKPFDEKRMAIHMAGVDKVVKDEQYYSMVSKRAKDSWDKDEERKVALSLRNCKRNNGSVYCYDKAYKNTHLVTQSKYEIDLLKRLEDIYNFDLNRIRQDIIIPYINSKGKQRHYLPDFILDDKLLLEVKSGWTYNKRGACSSLEGHNKLKINSGIKAGYKFILILDKNYEEFDTFFIEYLKNNP